MNCSPRSPLVVRLRHTGIVANSSREAIGKSGLQPGYRTTSLVAEVACRPSRAVETAR